MKASESARPGETAEMGEAPKQKDVNSLPAKQTTIQVRQKYKQSKSDANAGKLSEGRAIRESGRKKF